MVFYRNPPHGVLHHLHISHVQAPLRCHPLPYLCVPCTFPQHAGMAADTAGWLLNQVSAQQLQVWAAHGRPGVDTLRHLLSHQQQQQEASSSLAASGHQGTHQPQQQQQQQQRPLTGSHMSQAGPRRLLQATNSTATTTTLNATALLADLATATTTSTTLPAVNLSAVASDSSIPLTLLLLVRAHCTVCSCAVVCAHSLASCCRAHAAAHADRRRLSSPGILALDMQSCIVCATSSFAFVVSIMLHAFSKGWAREPCASGGTVCTTATK